MLAQNLLKKREIDSATLTAVMPTKKIYVQLYLLPRVMWSRDRQQHHCLHCGFRFSRWSRKSLELNVGTLFLVCTIPITRKLAQSHFETIFGNRRPSNTV